jgi:hypothetical protein
MCTHGSVALQVVRNLRRSDNVDIDKACIARTSKLQRWHEPSKGGATNDKSRRA